MDKKKGRFKRYSQVLAQVLREHALFIVIACIPVLLAIGVANQLDFPYEPSLLRELMSLFTGIVPLVLVILAIWQTLRMICYDHPESPLRALWRRGISLLEAERIIGGVLALTTVMLFMSAFAYFKVMIPKLIPFSWDITFAELDRWLHFGVDPFRLLMPVLGTPLMTTFINVVYHLWLFVVYFVLFVACFTRHKPPARMTFLIAFVLAWFIGGNVLATLFSSAGPVYYHRLGLGDDFVPLVSTLHEFANVYPVWALDVHEILWDGYTAETPAGGISAMPSMHLASSALLALYGFTYTRWAGWLLTVFTGLILLGSVHLAWHYAVDSYAGILIAVLCWKLAAWLVRLQPVPDGVARTEAMEPER